MQDNNYLDSVIQAASILTAAKIFGKMHLDELKVMRSTCAFQDEINAGSSKIYSKVINSNHSSNFNKEQT